MFFDEGEWVNNSSNFDVSGVLEGEMGVPTTPLFQKMVIEICP